MSAKEIQDVAFKAGIFLFDGGGMNEGMIVPKYNIREGKIEYYFIPSSHLNDYRNARAKDQPEAHRYYGNLIRENSIRQAIF